MNTRKLLLAAVVLLTGGSAHAETVSMYQHPQGPFTLYRCVGRNFQEASRLDLAMNDLYYAGHEARFEILRAASASGIFVRAKFSYEQGADRTRLEASQMLFMLNVSGLQAEYPGFLERNGVSSWEERASLERQESYISVPTEPAYPKGVFNEYVIFPKGTAAPAGEPVPAIVKVTKESSASRPGQMVPAWSKRYYAECQAQELSEQEYVTERRTMLGEIPVVQQEPVSRQALAFPALTEALGAAPLYTTSGEYLAGKVATAAKLGAGAAVGVLIGRLIIGGITKSPAVAAFFLPTLEAAPALTLDLNGTGLSAREAQGFFGLKAQEQSARCAQDAAYRGFCERLGALEAALNAGPVL